MPIRHAPAHAGPPGLDADGRRVVLEQAVEVAQVEGGMPGIGRQLDAPFGNDLVEQREPVVRERGDERGEVVRRRVQVGIIQAGSR